MGTEGLTDDQRIVQQIIDIFGTQELLARHMGLNQSTVSLWKRCGMIPARRQRQIIEMSKLLVRNGKIRRKVKPEDFHVLKDALQPTPQEKADE